MQKVKPGRIIVPKGLIITPHERATIDVLEQFGYSGEAIKPTGTKGTKTPDLLIKGELWEIKSPTGRSRQTIERQFKRAAKQSKNVVIDSRRTKIKDDIIFSYIRDRIKRSRSTRQVVFIDKNSKIIVDFKKKV